MRGLGLVLLLVGLSGCVYSQGPHGRYMALDLPMHNETVVHKTVNVNAPAGTTVVMNEQVMPIYQDHTRRDCYIDAWGRQVCRKR